MQATELLQQDFGTLPALLAAHAADRAEKPALIEGDRQLSYAQLDALASRISSALLRDGVEPRSMIAICAATSIEYAASFLGILRAGCVVVPLAPSSTAEALALMLEDCAAPLLLLDQATAELIAPVRGRVTARCIALDGGLGGEDFQAWIGTAPAMCAAAAIQPEDGFNLIYSSGTTGNPKGILQSHAMRWSQMRRLVYAETSVVMISTPLYSNTTLVSFLPTLAAGGTLVLMAKFDARKFLELAQAHRATHAMLVPVQYRRLMEYPEFDRFDLSSFIMKFATSAPFPASLKADVLVRWPGGLIEFYGMTEGGGSCMLAAHEFPDKLATVGKPLPGHDIRLIDEEGREVAPGEVGEIVGRSDAMMRGYHNQAEKTAQAEWYSPEGLRFIRTGDVGRFDADGFLTLLDRKKDMIISGGFNIYPADLEAELQREDCVAEAAVVGVPSAQWGETPVAFVVLKAGAVMDAETLRQRVNARLGKTQRLSDVRFIDALPRSHIGKLLKRSLRDGYSAG